MQNIYLNNQIQNIYLINWSCKYLSQLTFQSARMPTRTINFKEKFTKCNEINKKKFLYLVSPSWTLQQPRSIPNVTLILRKSYASLPSNLCKTSSKFQKRENICRHYSVFLAQVQCDQILLWKCWSKNCSDKKIEFANLTQ